MRMNERDQRIVDNMILFIEKTERELIAVQKAGNKAKKGAADEIKKELERQYKNENKEC